MRQYHFYGAPFDHSGAAQSQICGVDFLRRSFADGEFGLTDWITIRNQRWQSQIQDCGNIRLSPQVHAALDANQTYAALAHYSYDLYQALIESYQQGAIPITFGGDHAIALATVQAALDHVQSQNKRMAVVWIDAHADCNDSTKSNLHGKPASILMRLSAHQDWQGPRLTSLAPQDLILFAQRDLMLGEKALIDQHPITLMDMAWIDQQGFHHALQRLMDKLEQEYDYFYVTFDYDCLEGCYHRACATPNIGGLMPREAIHLVHQLAQHRKFIGIDFVEYLADRDPEEIEKGLMLKLIDAVFGFRC
ncbi:Arginase [Vibrio stylophorae]|uniref:Arginase n=1 Tax=Vibrio stylophorae TaxID=659351 RepID=A0ABM8ZY93_9VIBR|nr:arginase family protein [Vibrio stylophorae]CAH0535236.1 Arginase [Vibrio stylophorae]